MGPVGKKMKIWAATAFFLASPLMADFDNSRTLLLMHRGLHDDAIDLYQASIPGGAHNHQAIEHMCQIILEQGAKDPDPEIQLITLFGASIAANEKVSHIIEDAMKSPFPPIQLAALGLLGRFAHDDLQGGLAYALRSPHLVIRLEALFQLAENKDPKTATYAESLMAIIPEELLSVFPPILAEAGDGACTKILKKLASHTNEMVRLATVLTLAKHHRDDFLPKIRSLATHNAPPQLEACAYALGTMRDRTSVQRLQQLTRSNHENVKLMALAALYKLGIKESKEQIEALALKENLFAIASLDDILGCEETLAFLVNSPSIQVRINSAIGLLKKKDKRCMPVLMDILLKDSRDYAFVKLFSPGKSIASWKAVPSAQQQAEDNPAILDQTRAFKSAALTAAIELDEQLFLQIADKLLSSRQNDLVHVVIPLLENKQTPEAIDLLKKYQQQAGAPLVRQYCNLALYRLKVEGPYETLIKEWIFGHMHECMFRFKAPSSSAPRDYETTFDLSPDETSQLLIGSIEALAKAQNNQSIEVLLESIKRGHKKNKYALAGLLMRIAQ
jgi:HEAT repeat protein